jgi:nucleotide-binding universal stress UspA family protein
LAAILEEEQADLVVMTTHGRSGLSLLLTGSVATNLIHNTNLPVILIKPDETQGLEKAAKQVINVNMGPILVTLDGTAGSETILDAAANLARELGVKIHLFEVVSLAMPSVVLSNLEGGVDDYYYLSNYDLEKETKVNQGHAEQYLKEIQARLREKGVECFTAVQLGEPEVELDYKKEPLSRIIEYAKEVKAQMVAMATHSQSRLGQVMLGSVAEEVVLHSHLPVMLTKNVTT